MLDSENSNFWNGPALNRGVANTFLIILSIRYPSFVLMIIAKLFFAGLVVGGLFTPEILNCNIDPAGHSLPPFEHHSVTLYIT